MIVYFNGKLISEKRAAVSIHDHGFLYGDGVYETLRVYKGKPFLLHEHLRRLNTSLLGIRLSPPLSLIEIGRAVKKTVEANRHSEAAVRLTITRGVGAYGFNPANCKKATMAITSTPFKGYPSDLYRKGMTAAVVSIRRNSPQSLPPYVKSTSCLNGILAKIESLDAGADEGIMLAQKGTVSEGTVSNVFVVKKNKIVTPRLEGDLLPGVTRSWVCRLARHAGYRLEEKALRLSELIAADEIFLTSTLMEVMPVSRLLYRFSRTPRRRRFGPYPKAGVAAGPITRDLMRRFRKSISL